MTSWVDLNCSKNGRIWGTVSPSVVLPSGPGHDMQMEATINIRYRKYNSKETFVNDLLYRL